MMKCELTLMMIMCLFTGGFWTRAALNYETMAGRAAGLLTGMLLTAIGVAGAAVLLGGMQ